MPRNPFAPTVDQQPDAPPATGPARRRFRMGQADSKGRGTTVRVDPSRDFDRRARAEEARRLVEGGRNKGEQAGFGATAGKAAGRG